MNKKKREAILITLQIGGLLLITNGWSTLQLLIGLFIFFNRNTNQIKEEIKWKLRRNLYY